MSVKALRERVHAMAGNPATPAMLCITGASGAGKTTVLSALREHIEPRVLPALAFDSLGVPSEAEMHAAWDSPRAWQKAMTYHWVHTARHVYRTHPLVVLEGSFDPQYAIAATAAHRLRSTVVLLHTEDAVRSERLAKRGQPELATADMCAWASYLREQAQQLGGVVVDATGPIEQVVDALCVHAVALVDAVAEATASAAGDPTRGLRMPRTKTKRTN
jgi:thymidylate kinase